MSTFTDLPATSRPSTSTATATCSPEHAGLFSLPTELHDIIGSHMTQVDIRNLRSTCRELYQTFGDSQYRCITVSTLRGITRLCYDILWTIGSPDFVLPLTTTYKKEEQEHRAASLGRPQKLQGFTAETLSGIPKEELNYRKSRSGGYPHFRFIKVKGFTISSTFTDLQECAAILMRVDDAMKARLSLEGAPVDHTYTSNFWPRVTSVELAMLPFADMSWEGGDSRSAMLSSVLSCVLPPIKQLETLTINWTGVDGKLMALQANQTLQGGFASFVNSRTTTQANGSNCVLVHRDLPPARFSRGIKSFAKVKILASLHSIRETFYAPEDCFHISAQSETGYTGHHQIVNNFGERVALYFSYDTSVYRNLPEQELILTDHKSQDQPELDWRKGSVKRRYVYHWGTMYKSRIRVVEQT